MSVIIPFLVLIGISLAFWNVVKKIQQANARANRPRPAANTASRPAEPTADDRFDGAESAFKTGAFDEKTDFETVFDAEPDPSVTYEEGIDPCHDDMEHIAGEEDDAQAGMDEKTASELLRAFVMSEVLTRKKRR